MSGLCIATNNENISVKMDNAREYTASNFTQDPTTAKTSNRANNSSDNITSMFKHGGPNGTKSIGKRINTSSCVDLKGTTKLINSNKVTVMNE